MIDDAFITDANDIARVQERLDKAREMNAHRMFTGFLDETDVSSTCLCCTFPKRVLATLDSNGYAQYTCPESRITMRYMPGRPMPFTDPQTGRTELRESGTYVAGHIRLRG